MFLVFLIDHGCHHYVHASWICVLGSWFSPIEKCYKYPHQKLSRFLYVTFDPLRIVKFLVKSLFED